MTAVTRRGQYALGDANLARGAGETSLYSPNRSNLDWQSSLAETAQDAGDKIRGAIEGVLDGAVQEIYDLTGIDLSSIVNLLNQLLTSPLDSLGSVGLGDVLSVLGQFLPFLPGVDPSTFDPAAAATQFINSILNPTGLLANWPQLYQVITGASGALNELGELFQQGLFGQINPGRLGQISAAAIDNLNPETLDNPGFDTDASIRDNEEVEWDGTFGRTRPGSMKIVADGTTHTAISNPLRVVASRTINVEIWTYYAGVTANPGTTPIRLSVGAYQNPVNATDPPIWVADTLIPAPSIVSPAGNSISVAGNVGGWIKIVGSYTVPAGVDRVVNKVQVTEDCLSGTVHFDDGSRKRAGLLPKEYVEGLLADLAAHAAKIQATLNKGWEALTGLPAAVDKTVDDLKAALQNIPQANIAGLAAALASAGQDIRDAIVNAITGGSGTGHSTADVIAALLNIPQHLINGLEDDLAEAGDAIADVWDDVRDTWNKVVGGYRRTTVTGQTSADVEEVMISVGQEILVAQESTITLANQQNAPRNVPFWVSPNRFEEVSFPRALLQPVPTIGSGGGGSTRTGSGLGVLDANWNAEERDAVQGHTHSAPSHTHVMGFAKPLYTIPAGTLALTAVTMTQDRLVNVARFLAGGGTPPSTALYVGIYSIDPATGTMTLVYDYGDQKGNINTGADLYETALTLPNDVLVDAGSMFAVGILPVGGSFAVGAVRRQPISTAALVYPAAATELVSGQSSLPSTVANGSMDHTSTHRIWVSLGQAVDSVPEDNSPVTLTMTFNVANTSNWSSPSFQQYGNASSNFTVDNGQIYGGGPTVLFGDVTYWRSALCLTPVHTNDHMAEITLGTGWDDNAYGYATDRAYVRCNSSGTSGVCLHVDATGGAVRVRIATTTDLVSIGTVRATVSGIPYVVGDRFSIRAVGNVYQAYRNDDPIPGAVWTDSGNVVPIGKAWRRTAFGSGSRCTNGFTRYAPAHIDSFKAADLAA